MKNIWNKNIRSYLKSAREQAYVLEKGIIHEDVLCMDHQAWISNDYFESVVTVGVKAGLSLRFQVAG